MNNIRLDLTPKEFKFLLSLIESDWENAEALIEEAKLAGFKSKHDKIFASLRKKANNTYQEWEISEK